MNWWDDPEKVKQRAENYKKNFLKKHGVENPQQLKEVKKQTMKTCEEKYGGIGYAGNCGEKSLSKTKNKFGRRNIMRTEEGKKHFRGDLNPLRNEKHKAHHSKCLKEYYEKNPHHTKGKSYEEIMGSERAESRKQELKKSGAYGQSITPRISAPQKELFKMVLQKYPTAVLEYPVLDYCLDIAVPELKLCFEYDGSYWHNTENDKKRDEALQGLGWKVTRYVDELPSQGHLMD